MKIIHSLYDFIFTNKRSIFFFLTIGVLTAVIYFGLFTLFWKFTGFSYQYAVSVAYVLSVIVHFTANRNITFKSQDTNIFTQLKKYLVMVLINYAITLIIVRFTVESLNLSPYIGIFLAIGTTVSSGYLMSRYWIFHTITD